MKKINNEEALHPYNRWRFGKTDNACIDIDSVEIKNDKVVAIIETTSFREKRAIDRSLRAVYKRIGFQLKIQMDIAEKLDVPLFLVIHSDDFSYFLVMHIVKGKDFLIVNTKIECNEDEYIDFLNNLDRF